MTDRWAFRRIDIPDFVDPDQTYLTRWKLRTPWFGIYLHKICLPDSDRHLHDHPWAFATLVLKGGYQEQVPVDPTNPCGPRREQVWKSGSFHTMRLNEFHGIQKLLKGTAWTLVFVGPYRQEWGFATPFGKIPQDVYFTNRDYYGDPRREERMVEGCDPPQ